MCFADPSSLIFSSAAAGWGLVKRGQDLHLIETSKTDVPIQLGVFKSHSQDKMVWLA